MILILSTQKAKPKANLRNVQTLDSELFAQFLRKEIKINDESCNSRASQSCFVTCRNADCLAECSQTCGNHAT